MISFLAVAGSFFDDNDQTLNVTVGQQLTIDCPPHGYTKYAIYNWGGLTALGTWLFSDVENALVMGDGRLFFSHVTKANLAFIKQKRGIRCLVEAKEGGSSFNFQKSGVFRFKITGGRHIFIQVATQEVTIHIVKTICTNDFLFSQRTSPRLVLTFKKSQTKKLSGEI